MAPMMGAQMPQQVIMGQYPPGYPPGPGFPGMVMQPQTVVCLALISFNIQYMQQMPMPMVQQVPYGWPVGYAPPGY